MEDIFFFHVCSFVDSKTFHETNLSLLCKREDLKKRQNIINRKQCAYHLNQRFWKNDLRNIMHIFFDNYTQFMKYTISILLKEVDADSSTERDYHRHTMFIDKFVVSNTIIEYDSSRNISHIDFTSCQDVVNDVYICSTYRLGPVKKRILLDNHPYAKALIY
tara:strand:- start:378 stop:863 length:486 start_codon:yes stop_codon:yes gene_type:complete